MPILHPTCDNPDELLAWPGPEGPINRIQIERSDTGGGAGYANIGTSTITAATRAYTFYDPNGDTGDWYRWYFSNAANTFPSSANRVYSIEQQPGPEAGAYQVCSLYDVKQRLGITSTDDDELLSEIISNISAELEDYCRTWLVPRPTVGTQTLTFDIARGGRSTWLRLGKLVVPIRSMSAVNIATTSQPDTGGAYTAATLSQVVIRPRPLDGDPGYRLVFIDNATGPVVQFYAGENTLQVTGAYGPPYVAAWANEAGIAAVTRRYIAKESATAAVAIGPDGAVRLLSDLPPGLRMQVDAHRFVSIG